MWYKFSVYTTGGKPTIQSLSHLQLNSVLSTADLQSGKHRILTSLSQNYISLTDVRS